MRNTADVTGGKPIAVLLQSMSGVSAINPSPLLQHPWRKRLGNDLSNVIQNLKAFSDCALRPIRIRSEPIKISRKLGPNSIIAYGLVQSLIHIQAIRTPSFGIRHFAQSHSRVIESNKLLWNGDTGITKDIGSSAYITKK
jgi:hypothetical protein